jgi:hypothetical protein
MKSKQNIKFCDLSLNRRKRSWIKLKNRIRLNEAECGGLFYTDSDLSELESSGCKLNWFDCAFLGKKQGIIWNATILTAQDVLWEQSSTKAFDETYARLTNEEAEAEFNFSFIKTEKSASGQVYYEMVAPPKINYDKFDGLTFSEEKDRLCRELLSNQAIDIYESVEIDHGYRYGTGVTFVVDMPPFGKEEVARVIERFMASGEIPYTGSTPIPKENLIWLPFDEVAASTPEKVGLQSVPVRFP